MDPKDKEYRRLKRLLLLSFYLVLFLIIGIVAYFSLKLGDTDKTVNSQGIRVDHNAAEIRELKATVKELKDQAKVPGPEGIAGANGANGTSGLSGKDSQSTSTVIERQTVQEVPLKGTPFTFADFTPDQLASLKGENARQPVLCKLADGTIGWRLIDNTICLELGS